MAKVTKTEAEQFVREAGYALVVLGKALTSTEPLTGPTLDGAIGALDAARRILSTHKTLLEIALDGGRDS